MARENSTHSALLSFSAPHFRKKSKIKIRQQQLFILQQTGALLE